MFKGNWVQSACLYNLQPGGLREEDHRFRASLAYVERPCIKQNIDEASIGVGLPLSVRSLPSLCEALESVPWGEMWGLER